MRLIFKDVPVIYGFSSKAPRWADGGLDAGPLFSIGRRRRDRQRSGKRKDARTLCRQLDGRHQRVERFGSARGTSRRTSANSPDDRLSAAQKLAFIHQLLGREMAEVRMLPGPHREIFGVAERRRAARCPRLRGRSTRSRAMMPRASRYLDFARDADQPAVRARMLELAARLGWLSPAEKRAELMRMIGDQLARNAVSSAEVDLICALNKDRDLDQELSSAATAARAGQQSLQHAAVLACLGSADARAQMLLALTSPNDEEVQIAQVYLRHRPIADVNELRLVTSGIARMTGSNAQVHALDTLASQHLSDPESLEELARLFPLAESGRRQTRHRRGPHPRRLSNRLLHPSSCKRCVSIACRLPTART